METSTSWTPSPGTASAATAASFNTFSSSTAFTFPNPSPSPSHSSHNQIQIHLPIHSSLIIKTSHSPDSLRQPPILSQQLTHLRYPQILYGAFHEPRIRRGDADRDGGGSAGRGRGFVDVSARVISVMMGVAVSGACCGGDLRD